MRLLRAGALDRSMLRLTLPYWIVVRCGGSVVLKLGLRVAGEGWEFSIRLTHGWRQRDVLPLLLLILLRFHVCHLGG